MTKLIATLVIIAVLYVGYQLFLYWDKVSHEQELAKKEATTEITPDRLEGMPWQLQSSLDAARKHGATGLREWLQVYGGQLRDPHKAWLELDYCVMIARDNPAEARRIFADVKKRTPQSSPIMPRIKKLEDAYK
jgi:hypothetical protein